MKNDQQISSPNQGRGKPFRGQGDNCPHIPKKLLELPLAFLTLYQQHSEFTMKKNKKNKNHDYQNKNNNKQNVRRDVLIGKTNEILSL